MDAIEYLEEWFVDIRGLVDMSEDSTMGEIKERVKNNMEELKQFRKEKAPNK